MGRSRPRRRNEELSCMQILTMMIGRNERIIEGEIHSGFEEIHSIEARIKEEIFGCLEGINMNYSRLYLIVNECRIPEEEKV